MDSLPGGKVGDSSSRPVCKGGPDMLIILASPVGLFFNLNQTIRTLVAPCTVLGTGNVHL